MRESRTTTPQYDATTFAPTVESKNSLTWSVVSLVPPHDLKRKETRSDNLKKITADMDYLKENTKHK